MLHIILHNPEIPQNTGSTGRLCAIAGARLHLIHPLGFEINDRNLKRSGMDYWHELDVHEHENWEAFLASGLGPTGRIWLFTTKASKSFWDVSFADGDGLLFGNEGHGAPPWLHDWAGENRLNIPHRNKSLRSINLATAVGISTFEVLRQLDHVPSLKS